MEALEDLPYKAEYAKSGRASCRKCKGNIAKDTLRLAAMIQSPAFDGKVPYWYHYMCFFGKLKPKSEFEIAHFDSLRWDDQQKIKSKLGGAEPTPDGKGKSKKSKKNTDFNCEYAKSGRAACRGCSEKILKGEIRISKKEYESDTAKRFGPVDLWHHVDCFVKERDELQFFDSADVLSGFNTLSADDKKMLKNKIKKKEGKRKAEDTVDSVSKKLKVEDEDKMQKQNKKMFQYRDLLSKNLKKSELVALLEHNNYIYFPGEGKNLDILADLMTFGVMKPCTVCNDGVFIYRFGAGYVCTGNLSEWTKCTNILETAERMPFKIPNELKDAFPFLNSYKYKDYGPRVLVIKENEPQPSTTNGVGKSSGKPLENMEFVISGKGFSLTKQKMKDKIVSLGGKVATDVKAHTAAVISNKKSLDAGNKVMKTAEGMKIQCVSEDFLDEVDKGGAALMISKKCISTWDSEPILERINKSKKKSGSSLYTKSVPDKLKVKLKGGAAVDPDSELEDVCHVYQQGSKLYSAVLGMVDVIKGTNSYYKLQLLEGDNKRGWWVFRSWGRIGTTIGGNKLQEMEDLIEGKCMFESLYEEKTGNQFGASEFKKLPKYWYPLELDFGQEKEEKKVSVKDSKSKLHNAIKNFVSLIFDIDTMKNTLVEFEIDLKKMPLGKLSKRQIEKAYKVLSEALILIKSLDTKKETTDEDELKSQARETNAKILDCSNRFFTLIPHDFGMAKPPLLNDEEYVKTKINMLDNLCEIEIAYNLLKSEDDDSSKELDPIDKHYKKLKTKMSVLSSEEDEYKMIKKYLKNTHASTHSHYKLELQEVFKVERDGENKRFKPFKKLPNHQLLWHGSRLTNFAGILSQGLRIAPPEAPATGYMFGKGVYFADMVSKSANYCHSSGSNNIGILLLCDVALGDMYERLHADYVTSLPKGKHSTKGVGQTCPNPSQDEMLEGNIKVPLGKSCKSGVKNGSLLYNEYIVYDVAQINAKYLVQVKFNSKF